MKNDFGRYLQSVAERDVDLLLMEEFHVDPAFVTWFVSLAGIDPNSEFAGAWHSLNDQDGETDLLLRVRTGDVRIALLIENKISAPPQHEQDLRYHIRGQRAQDAGRFDQFVTAICAPQIYLDSVPPSSAYEYRIAYEDIREWFGRQNTPRSIWRHSLMEEAIEQGRRGYTMKVHAGRTAFHMAYWLMVQEEYPDFDMAKPGPKGPKSSWMRFKGSDFKKEVTLNHKNDQNCIDLEFERTVTEELTEKRDSSWPSAIRVVKTGKSAVLRLPVPSCDMDIPLADQADRVRAALQAARQLAVLANIFEHDR